MADFPKWMYHETLPPKLIEDPEEFNALGKEWKDSPAAFEVKTSTKKGK